jgi:hypothetical protein
MSLDSAHAESNKSKARSKITNGKQLIAGIDGRSTWVRRLRDLIALHVNDLGGIEAVSAAERSIVQRAATLTVELERMESAFAAAGEASAQDIDLYQRTANSLRRLLESLGLQRRAKDVTPTLQTYIAARAAEKAAAPPAGLADALPAPVGSGDAS